MNIKQKIFAAIIFAIVSAVAVNVAVAYREVSQDVRPATGLVLDQGTFYPVPAAATNFAPINVTLTSADTEYSLSLTTLTGGQTVKGIYFFTEDLSAFRWSLTTGLVATPTGSYVPVAAGIIETFPGISWPATTTIYFATDDTSKTVRGGVLY